MLKVRKAHPEALFDNADGLGSLKFMNYQPKIVVTAKGGIQAILEYRDGVVLNSLAGRY